MSLTEWQEAKAKIEEAIVKGAALTSITVDGQTMSFRSIDEMKKALAFVNAQIAAAGGASTSRFAATSKGV